MQHLASLDDWSVEQLSRVLDLAAAMKDRPAEFREAMRQRTLLMIFEKPSLRTRVSFETGMTQMGGHAIYYDMSTSPMGKGKETIEDSIRVVSRYVDLVMARLFLHADLEKMIEYSSVPVINALTDFSHPCQILADLQTIREHKGRLAGLTLAFMGDGNNNVTHSLMIGGAMAGMRVRVGCPPGAEYSPRPEVLDRACSIASEHGGSIEIVHDPHAAARDADVVYTDSWMSYHIPPEQLEARVRVFQPYQVNAELMAAAEPEALFMNCLPAIRGYEQSAEVIDGPQSVVFDQAENRLHAQKAVMHMLLQARGLL